MYRRVGFVKLGCRKRSFVIAFDLIPYGKERTTSHLRVTRVHSLRNFYKSTRYAPSVKKTLLACELQS